MPALAVLVLRARRLSSGISTADGDDAVNEVAESDGVVLGVAQYAAFVDNEAAIPVRLWHLAVLDSLVEVLLRDKAIVVERGHLEAIEDARIFDVRDGHAVGKDDKANKVARRLRE